MPRRTLEQRFWEKVDRRGPDECWPWLASTDGKGYGSFRVGKHQRAHRFAYELLIGPIPAGLVIDHLCRNRACVNPAHMEPVTPLENQRRGIHGNSKKTHCPQGHPYDDGNTYRYRGRRICKACRRQYRQRLKG
jgi:hypothetical protein